jgi:hypothetical protein
VCSGALEIARRVTFGDFRPFLMGYADQGWTHHMDNLPALAYNFRDPEKPIGHHV